MFHLLITKHAPERMRRQQPRHLPQMLDKKQQRHYGQRRIVVDTEGAQVVGLAAVAYVLFE